MPPLTKPEYSKTQNNDGGHVPRWNTSDLYFDADGKIYLNNPELYTEVSKTKKSSKELWVYGTDPAGNQSNVLCPCV